jgi:acyl-CoA synthetase (AMP-forming)/AMP-acid ligase II
LRISRRSAKLGLRREGRSRPQLPRPRGALTRAYTFRELREDALQAAYRLIAHGVKPADRIALIAETGPEFASLFFGVVFAGAWPVPLPLPTSFGGRESYIEQLGVQLGSSDPKMLFFPPELASMAGAAAEAAGVEGADWESFAERRPSRHASAGGHGRYRLSAIFERIDALPARVAVTHNALLNNLAAHSHGMQVIDSDRCISWLPGITTWAGRLPALANRQPDVDRLSEDRGLRPPPACLARSHQPQSRHVDELFADLRLRHLRAPHRQPVQGLRAFRPFALADRRQRRRT